MSEHSLTPTSLSDSSTLVESVTNLPTSETTSPATTPDTSPYITGILLPQTPSLQSTSLPKISVSFAPLPEMPSSRKNSCRIKVGVSSRAAILRHGREMALQQQQQQQQQQEAAAREAECGEHGEVRNDGPAKRLTDSVSGSGFLRRKFSGFWKKRAVADDGGYATDMTTGEQVVVLVVEDVPPKVPPKSPPPTTIEAIRFDNTIRPALEIAVKE